MKKPKTKMSKTRRASHDRSPDIPDYRAHPRSNNLVWDIRTIVPVERLDHTMTMQTHIADWDHGGAKAVIGQSVGGLAYIIAITGLDGEVRRYMYDWSVAIDQLIRLDEHLAKVKKLPRKVESHHRR